MVWENWIDDFTKYLQICSFHLEWAHTHNTQHPFIFCYTLSLTPCQQYWPFIHLEEWRYTESGSNSNNLDVEWKWATSVGYTSLEKRNKREKTTTIKPIKLINFGIQANNFKQSRRHVSSKTPHLQQPDC